MSPSQVHIVNMKTRGKEGTKPSMMTPQRLLLAGWFFLGMVPLLLQVRSYVKLMMPHKMRESLVVPPGAETETTELASHCPVEWLFIAGVWWNIDPTHYYTTERERLCHFIAPQYNIHGNYLLGPSKAIPSSKTPSSCSEDSFPIEYYFYHGSIGYYAFYEEAEGSFCAKDKTAYVTIHELGTFDINGSYLAQDTGSDGYRKSYWYGIFGVIWTSYRAIQMRRCFISCKRYGERCERMGERLRRKIAVVFAQENMRLAAHGATNYHRVLLLYLLVEGLMSDLFMLIVQDGLLAKVQYVSFGYNLSGVLLLVYEMIENTKFLRDKWRVVIKRILFCYESSLLGELLSVIVLDHFLTSINRSSLKKSKATAVAVSYYAWSLVGHGIFIIGLIAFIISVRTLWATTYAWWMHRTWAIFSKFCCVDSMLGQRNKMVMLSAYHLHNGQLYYKVEALKAFGVLKTEEEDGSQFVVVHKLHWFAVPTDNLFVIGAVAGHGVEPCVERPCTGMTSFFDHDLGGNVKQAKDERSLNARRSVFLGLKNKVSSITFLRLVPSS